MKVFPYQNFVRVFFFAPYGIFGTISVPFNGCNPGRSLNPKSRSEQVLEDHIWNATP